MGWHDKIKECEGVGGRRRPVFGIGKNGKSNKVDGSFHQVERIGTRFGISARECLFGCVKDKSMQPDVYRCLVVSVFVCA